MMTGEAAGDTAGQAGAGEKEAADTWDKEEASSAGVKDYYLMLTAKMIVTIPVSAYCYKYK
jgi:hypothetical protein